MESKDHARIHTGRNDRNTRPSGSRRRTKIERAAASPEERPCRQIYPHTCTDPLCEVHGFAASEARYQGLDGLHPREETEA